MNHSPVFDFEGHSPGVWLVVEAGEVDVHLVMTSDGARAVPSHDGVLVHDFAAVGLQGHRDSDSVTAGEVSSEGNHTFMFGFHLLFCLFRSPLVIALYCTETVLYTLTSDTVEVLTGCVSE